VRQLYRRQLPTNIILHSGYSQVIEEELFKIHDRHIKWNSNFIYLWIFREILRAFYIKNVNISYRNQIWNKECFCFCVNIAWVWDILWNYVHGKLHLSHHRKFVHKISGSIFIQLKFLVEIFYLKKKEISSFFFLFGYANKHDL